MSSCTTISRPLAQRQHLASFVNPISRAAGARKTGLVEKKKLAGSKAPRFAVGGSGKRGAKISQTISVARTKGGVSKIARRNQPAAKAKQALPEPAPYTRVRAAHHSSLEGRPREIPSVRVF